jgi:hypothetical protein
MKYKPVFITLILLVVLITGCEKKKNPTVTLLNGSFITTNTSISPGGLLKFKWEASKGKSDLSSFTVRIDGDDLPGFPNASIPTDVYLDSTYREGPIQKGNYTYSFVATDADGKTGSRALVITVE